MSCIINTGIINQMNHCEFNVGGIQRLFVANWTEGLRARVQVVNNEVVDITGGVNWIELLINKDTGEYQEIFNPERKNYRFELIFDIGKLDESKRVPMDILNKGEYIFVFKDNNNQWWLTGWISPFKVKKGENKTGKKRGNNRYEFVFEASGNEPAVTLSEGYIEGVVGGIDCSLSWVELALTSLYNLPVFIDCLVCEHPDSEFNPC